MNKRQRKELDIFTRRQVEIAKKTLLMPDQIVNVLGGMTKEEAREILKNAWVRDRDD